MDLTALIRAGLHKAQLRQNADAERFASAQSPIRYEPGTNAANEYHHRYYYLHCIHNRPYWEPCASGNCKRTRSDAERWLLDFARKGYKIPDL